MHHHSTDTQFKIRIQSGAKIWILQATFAAIGNQNQPHTYCLGLCSLTEADLYIPTYSAPEATQDSNMPPVCHAFMNMASTSA
jgi:hypothetical protein